MKKQLVIAIVVLTLVMTALTIVPAPTVHAPGVNWETVWQIGDVEGDDGTGHPTCYFNEFNYNGFFEGTGDVEPPFTAPFIVGTTPTNEFPYVTYIENPYYPPYANDFYVRWFGELPFGGRLIVSWSPGQSALETKVITSMDDGVPYTFQEYGYYDPNGMVLYPCPLVQSVVPLNTVGVGWHEIHFQHTTGDGTYWDWIRLEQPSSNHPPVADAGPDQTLEQTSHAGAEVTLDGSGSYDPDGDSLTYDWTWDEGSATGVSPTVTLPLGTTTVTLTVSDGTYTDSDTVDIKVQDTTPPEITLSGNQIVLWPPNHKYQTIKISDFIQSVTDICDANVGIDDVIITSVSSDEPENAKGDGDGNTWNDIVILNAQTVKLIAEREGVGNGRVYTINFKVTDLSGNTATGCCKIWVPHDQGAHSTAIDDGASAGYTVYYP